MPKVQIHGVDFDVESDDDLTTNPNETDYNRKVVIKNAETKRYVLYKRLDGNLGGSWVQKDALSGKVVADFVEVAFPPESVDMMAGLPDIEHGDHITTAKGDMLYFNSYINMWVPKDAREVKTLEDAKAIMNATKPVEIVEQHI